MLATARALGEALFGPLLASDPSLRDQDHWISYCEAYWWCGVVILFTRLFWWWRGGE